MHRTPCSELFLLLERFPRAVGVRNRQLCMLLRFDRLLELCTRFGGLNNDLFARIVCVRESNFELFDPRCVLYVSARLRCKPFFERVIFVGGCYLRMLRKSFLQRWSASPRPGFELVPHSSAELGLAVTWRFLAQDKESCHRWVEALKLAGCTRGQSFDQLYTLKDLLG